MSKQLAEKCSEHRRLYGDGRQPTHCESAGVEQRRPENRKMKCLYYYNYYYYNRTQHSKPLRYNIRCIRNFN